MKFSYHARDDQGRHQRGVVQAASEEAALQVLDRHGLYVTVLKEEKEQPLYSKQISLFERVSDKEVMLFSRQLSIMFRARVSLVDALNTIGSQAKNKAFQRKLLKITEEVEGGTALSEALGEHPKVFSAFYISIVKRGEALGNLSEVLEYLADYLERQHELMSKIKGALMYPIFVIVVAIAVLTLLALVVLPNLTSVLEEGDKDLPVITKVVIAVSSWYADWWWLALGVGAGAITGLVFLAKTKSARGPMHHIALRVPGLGTFLKMMYVARFGENLSTLIAGGVPIVQALGITSNIMGNAVYEKIIAEAKDSVSAGSKVADVFAKYPREFPGIFTQMMAVGEKTGSLDATMVQIVRFYQKEMARAVDAFLGLLEPVLIVGLGLLVGGLMASLMLPLYQSVSQI